MSSSSLPKIVIGDPEGIEINFSHLQSFSTPSQEIRNCMLTGKYTSDHLIRPANIVLSKVKDLRAQQATLEYVDFKDSYIESSDFISSKFDFGAIINCDFDTVNFRNCEFHNVSITGTSFHSVVFHDCNLEHMVIEGCKFFNCQFINCTTSNKLFEFCLFSDSIFDRTNIQYQTITGNFGLNKDNFKSCKIRNKSIGEKYTFIESLNHLYDIKSLEALEEFKVDYFVNGHAVIETLDSFDESLKLESWVGSARIPLTFTNLLTIYQEFLVDLYENNRISIFPLLKMHTLTDLMSHNNSVSGSFRTAIYGVHMTLTRYAEEFLTKLAYIVSNLERPLVLLVNGPVEASFYRENLPGFSKGGGLEITGVKLHNSPNELSIMWQSASDALPLIALLLASRFKLELSKYGNTSSVKEVDHTTTEGTSLLPVSKSDQKFELSFGFDEDKQHLYGLKLKSLFPGNLIMELGLYLSIKKVYEAKKILVRVLDSTN